MLLALASAKFHIPKFNHPRKSGYKREECPTSLHDLLKIVKILNLHSDCN